MNLFERFATEGMAYPASLLAFGALVILHAPSARVSTPVELQTAPRWLRRLVKVSGSTLQRRCGWLIVVFGTLIIVARLTSDLRLS